jgi:hypothetical protein
MKPPNRPDWFSNAGGWSHRHDLDTLRAGIASGLLDEQDEYGLSALMLAVTSGWQEGVDELLKAGADTERRYYRTGETALYMAVQERKEPIIKALIAAGANPDAANYWGVTPRKWHPASFKRVRRQDVEWPEPRIQNAEHLADHHYPEFQIPDREERESLKPGQAVNLYVYGPKSEKKQDTFKVRITARQGRRPNVKYLATLETPVEETHLPAGTRKVEFGPEHVATVHVAQDE